MELCSTIVNDSQPLTNFAKSSMFPAPIVQNMLVLKMLPLGELHKLFQALQKGVVKIILVEGDWKFI